MTRWLSDLSPALTTLLVLGALWYVAVVDQPVRIVVEGPRAQFEPGYIRLRITVERDDANRGLIVGVLGDDYESSSYEMLDGDEAPRTRWRTFVAVPAGEYVTYAALERTDGTTPQVRDSVRILPRY